MSDKYVFVMKELNKTWPGGKQVIKDGWLSFYPGAKIGVLGSNGAGKSTLLKIMAGIDKEFSGEAWAADGIKVGYLAQEPELDNDLNVFDNIMLGVSEVKDALKEFEDVSLKFGEVSTDDEMNELLAKQAELQEKIDSIDGWDIDRHIEIAMDALRCPPAESNISDLSGGEKRRVALCQLLLSKPDMLLLDEPTNHLDAESVAWLERTLADFSGTVVAITHDRYFLDNVAGWILEIDRGNLIPFEGNYSRLTNNLEANDLNGICETNQFGLSNQAEETQITLREDFKNGSNTGNAAIRTSQAMDKGFRLAPIKLEKLDDIWTKNYGAHANIDIIKMDIEGHEDFCLEGGKETIGKHRPTILMEVNKHYYKARNVELDERFFPLIPENYNIYKQNGLKWNRIQSLNECSTLDNVFLVPTEKLGLKEYDIFEG